MILPPTQWHDFYNGIREDKHISSEKKISIFVNGTDCDSLCSLKVLQIMLMASQTAFSTFVVANSTELRTALQQEFGNGVRDYRTAFCINCGATLDVRGLMGQLDNAARECVRLVFIDAHRPIHHNLNDHNDQTCVMLHQPAAGDTPVDSIPCADSVLDAERKENIAARRRLNQAGASSTDDQDREEELDLYYRAGSSYGLPASMILFQLARELQLGDKYALWMAVLGVTEQLLLQRVTESTPHYEYAVEQLENCTELMGATDMEQDLFGEGFESDEDEGVAAGTAGKGRRSAQGRIRRSLECKLLLHRHWSLMDAMVHSTELMAKLRTFRDGAGGRGTLMGVLAESGMPVHQATLQFNQMKVQYKSREALSAVLDNLETFVQTARGKWHSRYKSFVVQFSSHLTLSAADHVHVLWAHLVARMGRQCMALEKGFWEAYKATDIRHKQVQTGLRLAMAQHRQLLTDVAMADPMQLRSENVVHEGLCGDGQLLDLSSHNSWAATSPLVHPLTILRLGQVLQDQDASFRAVKSPWIARPMVCVGPPDAVGNCLLVALPGCTRPVKHPVTKELMFSSHDGLHNVHGGNSGVFQRAVEVSQVNRAQCGFFDSHVLVVHRDDVDVYTQAVGHVYGMRRKEIWSKEGLQGLM